MILPHPKLLPPLFLPLKNQPNQNPLNLSLPKIPSSFPHSKLHSSPAENSLTTLTAEPLKPAGLLSDRWPMIHGLNDWAGLLDPLDPLLRLELIRYGEMAQACYDAFDYDPFSRYCGSCKYSNRRFFSALGMPDVGYDVTRHLYATSSFKIPNFFASSRWARAWSDRANWIGYVAVSDDETSVRLGRRDVVVAWRGTVTRLEWIADLMDFLRSVAAAGIPCADPGVKVFVIHCLYLCI